MQKAIFKKSPRAYFFPFSLNRGEGGYNQNIYPWCSHSLKGDDKSEFYRNVEAYSDWDFWLIDWSIHIMHERYTNSLKTYKQDI